MSPLFLIQIACLLSGGIFAWLATWLTTQKGNTIKEILESDKSLESINLEIKDQLKLKANLPIVALYLVAAGVAIGVPAMINWQLLRQIAIVTVSGEIQRDMTKEIRAFEEVQIESSGSFKVRVPMTTDSRTITFEGSDYAPVSLEITPHKATNKIEVSFTNSGLEQSRQVEQLPIDVENWKVRLNQPIALRSSHSIATVSVKNVPSKAKPIRAIFQDIGEPKQ